MKLFKIKKNNQKGVTMIEILLSISIISFLVLTIYLTLTKAVSNMGESKQRVGAVAIANEKIEIIRNLDYDEIGIVNGVISGPMLASETVVRNGFDYNVGIDIRYIDDPLDDTGINDLINTDYKLVQVSVQWQHEDRIDKVEFVSSFVPDGVETDMGGGTLVLNTMTSGGDPVGNVSVHLDSVEDSPAVDYSTSTDNQGSLVLQGVPSQTYRISFSKSGYENVRTYPNPPASSFTPNNIDFYVNEGDLNSKNFFIDLASNLTFKAIDVVDESGISGIDINLIGGKEIGSDPTTYNLDDTSPTDSNGEIKYENISSGSYEISNPENLGTGDYIFIGSVDEAIFNLVAGDNLEVELLFGDAGVPSLYVTVLDEVTEEPIEGAGIGIANISGFDQGDITREDGTAFFPLTVEPPVLLVNGEHTIEVRMVGYNDYSDTIDINDLTIKEIKLTPQ